MSDIKLFSVKNDVKELPSTQVNLEKKLQILIENNMLTFFGVTFLKSEYTTTKGDRIDSLGLDENNCPVIFEYKRNVSENIINQGLFYLNWLIDHKGDFELLVLKVLGKERSDKIEWNSCRVICIANSFTKYDEEAIYQMGRNISLIRYKKFNDDLLLFEQVNSVDIGNNGANKIKQNNDKTFSERLDTLSVEHKNLYLSIKDYIKSIDDDVIVSELKLYTAFKKIKNFVCATLDQKCITLYLKLNPKNIKLEDNFTRDVSAIGHWGTGDLEVLIRNKNDFEKSKELIDKAYREN